LRRNSSILGHTTKEDEEITRLPPTMGHGVHHGPAVVAAVPFFLAFLLLYVHGIMRAPMVGLKYGKKGLMLGHHAQRTCIEHKKTIPKHKSRTDV